MTAQYASIKREVDSAIQRVLDNASFILGNEVMEFERAFAYVSGTTGAVSVASCSAALQLALLALGVGRGDEVITTAHSFMATAEAISNVGARPVFVDIDPKTFNIDPQQVAEAVTARTRAILPVHIYGQPADMDSLRAIAQTHGLSLIEDAAQAHGAQYNGRQCGSLGDIACFSFFPSKNLGAYGDAGAVCSNDESLLARVRALRDHGRTSKYEHRTIGFGERMDALQAAILTAKLPHLEAWTEARRAHARLYDGLLADTGVVTPNEFQKARHVYHLYVIRTPRRDAMLDHLRGKGIGCGVHYPIPLHRQPAYLEQGYGGITLPETERAAREVLSLPMYPELTSEQIAHVANAVREVAG